MNSEIHPSTSVNDPFQSALETKITRRSFLKRTAATLLVTVLAVNAFAEEGTAQSGGESDGKKKYILEVNGFGAPLMTYPEGHPQKKVPMDKNGEPMLVDDEANAFWMGTVTTHYLSTPEVLDPDGDEVWAALEVKFQWRTTSSFEEIKFPANIDGIDRWGYLSGHFNFKWIMVLSVSFIRLSRPPGTKQENEIPHTRQLWKSSRFAHSGNVTIDPDTGVPTLDPKPPCNLVKVDEGWAKEGNIWYDIHMKKTNSSWGFYMSAYRTEGGDPPLETATAFMRVSGTDSYTWEIVPYNVENN